MFPSRSMVEVGETSRFFPTMRIDGDTSLNTLNSPFQTPNANRYSSSTDSTSPESFFNTSFPISPPSDNQSQQLRTACQRKLYDNYKPVYEPVPPAYDYRSNVESSNSNYDNFPSYNTASSDSYLTVPESYNYDRHIIDTPLQGRQRPIVGRKIVGCHSSSFLNETIPKTDFDVGNNIWRTNTPQNTENIQTQYELFPSNDKNYEFCNIVKSPTEYSPNFTLPTRGSPTSSVVSSSTIFSQNLSLTWQNTYQNPITNVKPPFNHASHTGASSSHDEIAPSKMCMFCRKNGETPTVYMTHCVKEKIGNKYRVTCPILRSHVCMTCGASGDDAHTITYCPILRSTNDGKRLQSTTVTLKNTRIKSNGRRRY